MLTKTRPAQGRTKPRGPSPARDAAVWGGAGFLGALAPVLGGMHPFGLALAMGLDFPCGLYAAAGAAVGYALVLPGEVCARYLGALGALAAARLAGTVRTRTPGLWLSLVSGGGVLLLVQAILTAAGIGGLDQLLLTASEVALCCGLAAAVCTVWSRPAGTPARQLGLLVVFAAVSAALSPVRLGPVRAAWIVPAVWLLADGWRARRGQMLPAAVAAAAGLALAGSGQAFAGVCIAAGALAASWLPGEKAGMAAVYFAAGCLGAAAAPDITTAVEMIVSFGCAAAAFLCIPSRLLSRPQLPPRMNPAELQAAVRLNQLAGALEAVGQTVQQVVERLPRREEGYEWVVQRVVGQVCAGCSRYSVCWGEKKEDTLAQLDALRPLLENSGVVQVHQIPPGLSQCARPGALCESLGRGYALLQGRREAAARSRAMRAALTEQFGAVASALAAIGQQLGAGESADEESAARLSQMLWSLGLEPSRVSVLADRVGRVRANVLVKRMPIGDAEATQLAIEAGRCCKTSFELPRVTTSGAFTQLEFGEKAVFSPSCSEFSLPAKPGELCGDHAEHFCDARGNFHLILCDGMGTGKAAALDGAMAASLTSRLVQAGFGGEQAARLVNVALELKSDEDSAAALDVASVDLYTGQLQLFKAGAATSFLLRAGKVRCLTGGSLPVGILEGVVGGVHRITLYEDDLLVLCSDGALAAGEDWMAAQLEAFGGMAPGPLAEKLARAAADCTAGRRPDDITVQVMRMEKSMV